MSYAFHHNFSCMHVMRNEVFCDDVVFNHLRVLPVVDLKAGGFEIATARFPEIRRMIEDDCLFRQEHLVNILRPFFAASHRLQDQVRGFG